MLSLRGYTLLKGKNLLKIASRFLLFKGSLILVENHFSPQTNILSQMYLLCEPIYILK